MSDKKKIIFPPTTQGNYTITGAIIGDKFIGLQKPLGIGYITFKREVVTTEMKGNACFDNLFVVEEPPKVVKGDSEK